jgi:ABC-2 type transport system permease protein
MEVSAFAVLYRRTLREYRQVFITTLVVPLVLPLFILTIFTDVFSAIVHVPGFTDVDYATYAAPASVVLASMLGASTTGISVAVELQTGFYDRMRASPLGPRLSVWSRRIADGSRFALFAAVLTGVAALDGVAMPDWPLTLAVSVALAATWGVAYGGLALALCLRTASAEASQALVPLFFPILFMSTAFVPLQLLPPWLQAIARVNPVSLMCTTIRSTYVGSLDVGALLGAVGGVVALACATQLLVRAVIARAPNLR